MASAEVVSTRAGAGASQDGSVGGDSSGAAVGFNVWNSSPVEAQAAMLSAIAAAKKLIFQHQVFMLHGGGWMWRPLIARRARMVERQENLRQTFGRTSRRMDAYTAELARHGLEQVE